MDDCESAINRKTLIYEFNYYDGRGLFINLRPDRESNAKGSLVGEAKVLICASGIW